MAPILQILQVQAHLHTHTKGKMPFLGAVCYVSNQPVPELLPSALIQTRFYRIAGGDASLADIPLQPARSTAPYSAVKQTITNDVPAMAT